MLLSILLAAASATQGDPEFVAGDPATLVAKPTSAEALFDDSSSSLVEVSVKNTGALHVEPLVFRFAPRKAKGAGPHEVWRVAFPHHGRAGRGLAPGALRSYSLVVPLVPALAKDSDVSVTRASFLDEARELEEPVKIGRIRRESEFRAEVQRTIPVTRVELTNRLGLTIDAVFRATYTEPTEATTLVELRLGPQESRVFVIDELRTARNATWTGAEIKKLELVDWSALLADGGERAAELFTEAYEGWIALPADAPTVRARFVFEQEIGGERLAAQGRLRIDAAGGIELAPDEPFDPKARDATRAALEDVLQLVRRPTAEEALASSAIALLAWGDLSIVRFDNASFQDGQKGLHLALRDGRIEHTMLTAGDRSPRIWHTRPEGAGYVVTGRDQMASYQAEPQESERIEYVRLGELVLPSSYRRTFSLATMPEAQRRVQLALIDWAIDEDGGSLESLVPPSGPLAERLRAAWEDIYRYPDEAVELEGRFAIETPGTDAAWLGHRKVKGRFTLHDFRGARWSGYTIEVDGKQLGARERQALAATVHDRFRMFARRDFGGRGSFDGVFAGAQLEEHGDTITAAGVGVTELELAEGRPVRLVRAGGLERRYEWTRVGGAFVPKRIRTGDEELAVSWSKLSGGWLYPKKVVFRDVFEDWGPETLTLSKLALGDAD